MGGDQAHVPIPAKGLCLLVETGDIQEVSNSPAALPPHAPAPAKTPSRGPPGQFSLWSGAPWVGFRPMGSLTQSE